jgi:adenosine deaminase
MAHVRDLKAQNYIYAETRFAPQYHQRNGLSLEQVIENVLEGLHRGCAETGTLVKLIICIGREVGKEHPEISLAVAKAAAAFKDAGVVGLDLACNEVDYPPQLHVPAYQLAYGAQLHRTVHAGELARSEEERAANIVTALDDLKADGLGHAVPLVRHPSLLARIIRDRVRIESCPLSNRITGAIENGNLRELGLDQLLREGALVSLNTDDPLIFGTSLADVFQATCEAYNFGLEDVRQFTRNAVEGAFCSDDERAAVYYAFKHRGFSLFEP